MSLKRMNDPSRLGRPCLSQLKPLQGGGCGLIFLCTLMLLYAVMCCAVRCSCVQCNGVVCSTLIHDLKPVKICEIIFSWVEFNPLVFAQLKKSSEVARTVREITHFGSNLI